jgi:hypothetical protein
LPWQYYAKRVGWHHPNKKFEFAMDIELFIAKCFLTSGQATLKLLALNKSYLPQAEGWTTISNTGNAIFLPLLTHFKYEISKS